MRRLCNWAALVALLAVIAACGAGEKKGALCSATQLCPGGQGCYESECVALCGAACPSGERCVVSNQNGKLRCVTASAVVIAGASDATSDTGPADADPGDTTADDAVTDALADIGPNLTDTKPDGVVGDLLIKPDVVPGDLFVKPDLGGDVGDASPSAGKIICPEEIAELNVTRWEWWAGDNTVNVTPAITAFPVSYLMPFIYTGTDAETGTLVGKNSDGTAVLGNPRISEKIPAASHTAFFGLGHYTIPLSQEEPLFLTIALFDANAKLVASRTCEAVGTPTLKLQATCPLSGFNAVGPSAKQFPFIGMPVGFACQSYAVNATVTKPTGLTPTVTKIEPLLSLKFPNNPPPATPWTFINGAAEVAVSCVDKTTLEIDVTVVCTLMNSTNTVESKVSCTVPCENP